jgi:hypothetical protein
VHAPGEAIVALFVLVIVGVVVAQTWMDWRDAKRKWVVPNWAKGMALAGAVAASLTGLASYASYWLTDSAGQSDDPFRASMFWPELGFAVLAMVVIMVGLRTKRLKIMMVVTAVLIGAFWMGMSL